MGPTRSLPVIDVSGHRRGDDEATRVAATQIREALVEVGFLSIVGHGVPWERVTEIYDWAARYHALPIEAKIDHEMGPATMGYIPMGGARQGDLPALNAAFFMGRPGSSRNRFPVAGALPGFERAIGDYYRTMDAVVSDLLPLWSLAIGMPADHFGPFFDPALATLRMSHYPAVPAAERAVGDRPPLRRRVPDLPPRQPGGRAGDPGCGRPVVPGPPGARVVRGQRR